jgi:hypothetical protein
MAIERPQKIVPPETVRRQRTVIQYESDETVVRITHHYESGEPRVIQGAELDQIATGETTKTWKALARRLGKALDGDASA